MPEARISPAKRVLVTHQWKCRLFQAGMLAVWVASHWIGIPLLAFCVFPPSSQSLPWAAFFAIMLTPLYVYLVHKGDTRWRTGGVLAIRSWRAQAQGNASRGAQDDTKPRPELAHQILNITTGFAALLAFQTVRLHQDLSKDKPVAGFLDVLLITVATFFVVACVSNLIQIMLHHLSALRVWAAEEQTRFRRNLRILRTVSWHCLLTPVILVLCLLPYLWVAIGVNFLYGLSLYWYYFSLKPPPGFPDHLPRPEA